MSEDTTKTPEELAAEAAEAERNKPIESDAVNEFISDYLAETSPKKKEPEKKADDEPPPKKKAAPPAAKRKVAPPPTEEPEKIDYEKLATAAGEGAARAIAASKKTEEQDKKPEGDGLVPERKIQVLRRMEQLDPKLKGLADRFVSKTKELKAYADKWEKDNPGEEFNEEDDEHAEFIEKLEAEIDYDEEAYAEALADIKYDEREAKKKQEQPQEDPELTEIKLKHKREKRAAEIAQHRDAAANHFLESMGEEFAGLIKEDGSIDTEALAKIKETEPELHDEAIVAFKAVERLSQECFMIANDLVQFNERIPEHRVLSNFAYEREGDMMKLPKEERLDSEGREFLPKSEYDKLSAAQKKKHWIYTFDDISKLLAARFAKMAKERVAEQKEMFGRMAKARGIPVSNKEKTEVRPRPGSRLKPAVDEEEPLDEKPRSPTVSAESRLASAKNKGAGPPKTALQSWIDEAIS